MLLKKWLLNLREKIGLTQEEVATKCNISRQFYSMIENGDRVPSVKTAQSIANILGFNWTKFFEEDQVAS